MAKKMKAKAKATGSKVKKGTKLTCDSCGVIVTVDKDCSCDPCGMTCCGEAMTPVICC